MIKKIKLILIVLIAVIIAFKIGANHDKIKGNFGWIFESSEEEQALPELSNEEIEKNKSQNLDPIPPVNVEESVDL